MLCLVPFVQYILLILFSRGMLLRVAKVLFTWDLSIHEVPVIETSSQLVFTHDCLHLGFVFTHDLSSPGTCLHLGHYSSLWDLFSPSLVLKEGRALRLRREGLVLKEGRALSLRGEGLELKEGRVCVSLQR